MTSGTMAPTVPSNILRLPEPVLVGILREGADLEARGGFEGDDANPLLELRLVCREFRRVVDVAVDQLECVTRNIRSEDRVLHVIQAFSTVLPHWPNLQRLGFTCDWALQDLRRALTALARGCPTLQTLRLSLTDSPRDDEPVQALLEPLASLSALHTLKLSGLEAQLNYCAQDLSSLASLTRLRLVRSLAMIHRLPPRLTALEVDGAGLAMTHFSEMLADVPLTDLSLSSSYLHIMPALPTTLQRLTMRQTRVDTDADADAGADSHPHPHSQATAALPNLQSLDLQFVNAACVPGLRATTGLTILTIRRIVDLTSLPDLPRPASLRSLSLDRTSIRVAPLIGRLSGLRDLTITGCMTLTALPDVSALQELASLTLEGLLELRGIPGLGRLGSLTELSIAQCPALEAADEIPGLTSLRSLLLECADQYWPVPPLGSLTQLHFLSLRGIPNVQTLAGLEMLTGLERLKLSQLPALRGLPDLRGLVFLREIAIHKCPGVRRVQLPAQSRLRKASYGDVELTFG